MANRNSISGILFDKDGTLFDFYTTWAEATEKAALLAAKGDQKLADYLMDRSGRDPISRRYFPGSVIASGSNRQIAEHWASLLGHLEVEALYRTVSDFFLEYNGAIESSPVIDLDAFFLRLKARGYRLGIATMDSEQSARHAMDRHKAIAHLDFICGYDTGHGVKPEPGMVEAFARILGMEGVRAIAVVGDSPHDIHMAKVAGAGRAIGVLTGVSPREALFDAGADDVIESIAELEAIL